MSTPASPSPLVTAIIPAFNAARFVNLAVDSILAQQGPTVEVIVVDDCSSDDTAEVLAPYVAQGQVRLLRQTVNQGVAAARNRAIDEARGQFIAFLDADDLWLPGHLATALRLLDRHPDIDILMQDAAIVDLASGESRETWLGKHAPTLALLDSTDVGEGCRRIDGRFIEAVITGCFVHVQNLVARKRVFDSVRFDEAFRCNEDLDWAVRTDYIGGFKWAWVNQVSGRYHRHPDSLTAPSIAKHDRIEKICQILFQRYLQWPRLSAGDRRAIHHAARLSCIDLCYFARLRGDHAQAWHYWWEGLQHGRSRKQWLEPVKLVLEGLGLTRPKPPDMAP
jgi:glycosyltransferase involved in cell wall biosynthesis